MNKKIISLLFLLILLVSITISYAVVTHLPSEDNNPADTDSTVDDSTLANEIDNTLLDENDGVDIGEMI